MPKKSEPGRMTKDRYKERLRELQIALVKLQKDVIANDRRLLVLLEGRDAAGKDGLIKALTEHMSPRETRVVALPKPSDRERSQWYFQRYVSHLPSHDEIVVFNRSWYNRVGVERVMGFCTEDDVDEFFDSVQQFEAMLVRSGIELSKYYLDVSRAEQRKRLRDRRDDPLKQWKISPIDAVAQDKWHDYTKARDEMLRRTHGPLAPWTVVLSDDKKAARLAVLTDILHRHEYKGRPRNPPVPDESVLFTYGPRADKRLAR